MKVELQALSYKYCSTRTNVPLTWYNLIVAQAGYEQDIILLYFSMNYGDFSVKSKLIISLFETVKLSLSISLFQKIEFS